MLRYAENPNLGSGQKWRHRMYPVSVYQLIFLMAKILCCMTTAAVHR